MYPNSYFENLYGIVPMKADFKEKPFMACGTYYKDRAEAEVFAQKQADRIKSDVPIWKVVAIVKYPAPSFEVEELT